MDKKYNDGFTLIELIVSIAISSIIILMLFSVFNYNLKAFSKTTEAMDEQANLRLVSYKLTDQLRNIGYLDLDSDVTSPTVATDNYIFVEENQVKFGNVDGTTLFADEIIDEVTYSLSKNELGRYVLKVTIVGKVHSYTTDILLNNMVDVTQLDSADVDGGVFNFIQFNYTKPPLTMPIKVVEEYEDLVLEHPASLTVKKNKTFTYTAEATGGVTPYTFEISDETYNVGTVTVNDFTDTITWEVGDEIGELLHFNVKVIDGVLNEYITGFTIEIVN